MSKNTANANIINGIYLLDGSAYNTVINNTATGNDISGLPGGGICLDHATSNNLSWNTVNSNKYGIYLLMGANSNNIAGNTANTNNVNGIDIIIP